MGRDAGDRDGRSTPAACPGPVGWAAGTAGRAAPRGRRAARGCWSAVRWSAATTPSAGAPAGACDRATAVSPENSERPAARRRPRTRARVPRRLQQRADARRDPGRRARRQHRAGRRPRGRGRRAAAIEPAGSTLAQRRRERAAAVPRERASVGSSALWTVTRAPAGPAETEIAAPARSGSISSAPSAPSRPAPRREHPAHPGGRDVCVEHAVGGLGRRPRACRPGSTRSDGAEPSATSIAALDAGALADREVVADEREHRPGPVAAARGRHGRSRRGGAAAARNAWARARLRTSSRISEPAVVDWRVEQRERGLLAEPRAHVGGEVEAPRAARPAEDRPEPGVRAAETAPARRGAALRARSRGHGRAAGSVERCTYASASPGTSAAAPVAGGCSAAPHPTAARPRARRVPRAPTPPARSGARRISWMVRPGAAGLDSRRRSLGRVVDTGECQSSTSASRPAPVDRGARFARTKSMISGIPVEAVALTQPVLQVIGVCRASPCRAS